MSNSFNQHFTTSYGAYFNSSQQGFGPFQGSHQTSQGPGGNPQSQFQQQQQLQSGGNTHPRPSFGMQQQAPHRPPGPRGGAVRPQMQPGGMAKTPVRMPSVPGLSIEPIKSSESNPTPTNLIPSKRGASASGSSSKPKESVAPLNKLKSFSKITFTQVTDSTSTEKSLPKTPAAAVARKAAAAPPKPSPVTRPPAAKPVAPSPRPQVPTRPPNQPSRLLVKDVNIDDTGFDLAKVKMEPGVAEANPSHVRSFLQRRQEAATHQDLDDMLREEVDSNSAEDDSVFDPKPSTSSSKQVEEKEDEKGNMSKSAVAKLAINNVISLTPIGNNDNSSGDEENDSRIQDSLAIEEDNSNAMKPSEANLDNASPMAPIGTSTSDDSSGFKKPNHAETSSASSLFMRKRHSSTESSSNMSETSEMAKIQASDEQKEDYEHHLAYYRTPIVGRETVCIFCLVPCAEARPKLLTCLHSSCSKCFQDNLDDAREKGQAGSSTVPNDDEVSAEAVVSVSCPICKVSTTESEAVDNLLLTAASSSNPAETNETHTCNSCDEDNLAKSWCADCEEHLCGDCEKAHLRVKITRDHKVKAIVAPPKVSVTNPENKEAFLKVPTHCKTHPNSELDKFCETCDKLLCSICVNVSVRHQNHSVRQLQEAASDLKTNLVHSIADVKIMRNLLDENKNMLGAKIGELNIKEKSLIRQINEVKNFLIQKIERKFKDLTNEASKKLGDKRRVIEGRKSKLDRFYVQSDYALAFVDHAIQSSGEDDRPLLVAKRSMERQLRRLSKADTYSGLGESAARDLKMDLYFQDCSGQKLHVKLDSALKELMSEVSIQSGVPPVVSNSGIASSSTPTWPKASPFASPAKSPAAMPRALQSTRGASPLKAPSTRGTSPMKSGLGRGASPLKSPRGGGTRGGRGARGALVSSPRGRGQGGSTTPAASGRGSRGGGRGRGSVKVVPVRSGKAAAGSQQPGPSKFLASALPQLGKGVTIKPASSTASQGQLQGQVGQQQQQGAGRVPQVQDNPYYQAAYGAQATRPGQRPAVPHPMNQSFRMPQQHQRMPGPGPGLLPQASQLPQQQPQPRHQGPHPGHFPRPSPGPDGFLNAFGFPQSQFFPQQRHQIPINRPQGPQQFILGQSNPTPSMPFPPRPVVQQQQQQEQAGPRVPDPRNRFLNPQSSVTLHPVSPAPSSSWHQPQPGSSSSNPPPTVPSTSQSKGSNSEDYFKITLPPLGQEEVVTFAKNTTQNNKEVITIDDTSSTPKSEEMTIGPTLVGGQKVEDDSSNIDEIVNFLAENTTEKDQNVTWVNEKGEKRQSTENNEQSVEDPLKAETDASSSTSPPMVVINPKALLNTDDEGTSNEAEEKVRCKTPEMEGNQDEDASKDEEDGRNEDWCAVCHDGGDTLICCDRCPKIYHLYCYIPPLRSEPADDWTCIMCLKPEDIDQFILSKPDENIKMGTRDWMICRRILFELYNCYPESWSFKDCKDLNFAEYLEKVKHPIALDVIKERMDPENTEQYSSVQDFLKDLRRMFKNCRHFHGKDSATYDHGKTLEELLDKTLEQWLPDHAYDLSLSETKLKKKKRLRSSPDPGPSPAKASRLTLKVRSESSGSKSTLKRAESPSVAPKRNRRSTRR